MSSNVVIVYFWTDWMWYCNVQCTQFSRYVAQYGKLCISCIKFWYAFTTNKSAANLAFDDVDVVAEFLWINNFYISTATSRTNMIHTWFTIGFYAFGMTNWNDYTIIISFCIQLVRDSTNVQLLEATIFIVCRVHEKKKDWDKCYLWTNWLSSTTERYLFEYIFWMSSWNMHKR